MMTSILFVSHPDYEATSGICIAEIEGFKTFNMEEYYYCAAYFPNELLK